MAMILAANSTIEKKGLKPSSITTKQIRDQIEKVSREVVGHEGDGRPPMKNKGKNKVEDVPKKKKFSVTENGGSMASPRHLAPKSMLRRN